MNKNYTHLASLVFNEPHLCTPQYAETILAVLEDKLGLQEGLYQIQGSKAREASEGLVGDKTKVIPIIGAMTHRGSSLDAMSGIQSYQAIKSQIKEAMEDSGIKSVLLDIDSPGGSVAGAFDLRDYVLSCRGTKPIIALSQDTMASAAYLIGSACDKVYTTQTGTVGSIGVVAMHVDKSAQNKAQGVKPTFIYAGDYKTAGNSNEPLEGSALEYLQESVNDSYEMFINAVAEARGIDSKVIRDTEARVYRGEKATTVGLSDGVMSFDAAIQELAQMSAPQVPNTTKKQGMKMTPEEMEQMAADLSAAKKDNETLRGYLLSEGYSITKEGVSKPKEVEYIEVAGQKVDKATLPEAVVTALEASIQKDIDSDLTAFATTNFPNFDTETAKSLAKMAKGNDDLMSALKGADAALGTKFEELGDSDKQGDMTSAKDKFESAIKANMKENDLSGSVGYAKATANVVKTSEGRKLEAQARAEKVQ